MSCIHFTGTSTIQSRGEKTPVRGLWILTALTGSDTPWPTSIRSLVAYANWVKNLHKTSAFTWSGKTSRQISVPSSAVAIRLGDHVPWCFGRGASWMVSRTHLYPSTLPESHSTGILSPTSLIRAQVRAAGKAAERVPCGYVQQCGRQQAVLRETACPEPNRGTARTGRNHRGGRWSPCR